MKVSLSAYYEANFIPNINLERFHLKNRIKTLFEECNQRIGSRQIVGFLQSEGIVLVKQNRPEIAAVDYVFKIVICAIFFLPLYGILLNFLSKKLDLLAKA